MRLFIWRCTCFYAIGLYNGDWLCSLSDTDWRQTFEDITIIMHTESVLCEVWAKGKETVT